MVLYTQGQPERELTVVFEPSRMTGDARSSRERQLDRLSPIRDNLIVDVLETDTYSRWFDALRDLQAKARIDVAIRKMQLHGQLLGDVKPVGASVSEIRFHQGPGYRIYVTVEYSTLLILLVGGDKSTQHNDIRTAQRLAKEWRTR
ncbi:MAG: type II toxin-antitoxin system RelE/ParE family toxin [Bifidobacterium crudilactis]|uniref:type II toxin-antitoxin system RelE/ParE family toxin n=1 Tax=Bifidobacterium crudilactis TaxID=327277 RepID=UPI003F94CE55